MLSFAAVLVSGCEDKSQGPTKSRDCDYEEFVRGKENPPPGEEGCNIKDTKQHDEDCDFDDLLEGDEDCLVTSPKTTQ